MADTALPKTIGRYEIVREIGRGAMGVVYQGRDPGLGRLVAIKTLSLAMAVPDEQRGEFELRFQREARAAATLQHPGIVVVYDIGKDEATKVPFMALEFLRGRTLEAMLAEGRAGWQEALRIGVRLADALHHAHSQGIVHRDLKPANVMLQASGQPKIMDFGVARLEGSQLTTQGQVFGSPSYMSPEQATEARSDARSDLFSLGSIIYELLTGKRAFPGRAVSDVVIKLASEDPTPPSLLVPGLPRQVDAVLARAHEKSPAKRYLTAAAFAEDLEDLLAGRPPRHAIRQPAAVPASPPIAPSPLNKAIPTPPRAAAQRTTGVSTPPRAMSAESPSTARPSSKPVPQAAAQTRVAGSGGGALSLPRGKRVTLALLAGPRSGDIYELSHPSVLIGRAGGGAGIELADNQVSRAHALFECHGARFVIRDLESTNGTFVAGQRIREQTLEDREEFQVGSTRFMVIVADAD
jgi:serine/threonine-protein kinase